ncbi:MAG: precorrin-2 C(20)-methyltransferase [Eubacteriaceae bacterium]|nr:precorrin-2 C(20)-methyltransferase [Eubacteriaceae bacterium]
MSGTLYGIGVGPGDPELITLKAIKAIRSSDVICLPMSGDGEAMAYAIAVKACPEVELIEKLEVSMPMSRDAALLDKMHGLAAQSIIEKLDEGKNVAFLTIGDPCLYSTYMYVHKRVAKAGYGAEIINGVASFLAVCGRLGISAAEASEPVIIIPASYEGATNLISQPGTKVLMKTGRAIEAVKEAIAERGLENQTYAVSNCGLEGEKVYIGSQDLESNYFTVIIIKDDKEMASI